MLVPGRERAYISQFILTRAYDSSAITPQDIDVYAAAYSAPTGMPVQFELMADARVTLQRWLDRRGGKSDDFVFPSRIDYLGHLSTRQYARLVDDCDRSTTWAWTSTTR